MKEIGKSTDGGRGQGIGIAERRGSGVIKDRGEIDLERRDSNHSIHSVDISLRILPLTTENKELLSNSRRGSRMENQSNLGESKDALPISRRGSKMEYQDNPNPNSRRGSKMEYQTENEGPVRRGSKMEGSGSRHYRENEDTPPMPRKGSRMENMEILSNITNNRRGSKMDNQIEQMTNKIEELENQIETMNYEKKINSRRGSKNEYYENENDQESKNQKVQGPVMVDFLKDMRGEGESDVASVPTLKDAFYVKEGRGRGKRREGEGRGAEEEAWGDENQKSFRSLSLSRDPDEDSIPSPLKGGGLARSGSDTFSPMISEKGETGDRGDRGDRGERMIMLHSPAYNGGVEMAWHPVLSPLGASVGTSGGRRKEKHVGIGGKTIITSPIAVYAYSDNGEYEGDMNTTLGYESGMVGDYSCLASSNMDDTNNDTLNSSASFPFFDLTSDSRLMETSNLFSEPEDDSRGHTPPRPRANRDVTGRDVKTGPIGTVGGSGAKAMNADRGDKAIIVSGESAQTYSPKGGVKGGRGEGFGRERESVRKVPLSVSIDELPSAHISSNSSQSSHFNDNSRKGKDAGKERAKEKEREKERTERLMVRERIKESERERARGQGLGTLRGLNTSHHTKHPAPHPSPPRLPPFKTSISTKLSPLEVSEIREKRARGERAVLNAFSDVPEGDYDSLRDTRISESEIEELINSPSEYW